MTTTLKPTHALSLGDLKIGVSAHTPSPDSALAFHRGAIDQTTITTQPPTAVIKQVTSILHGMGVEIHEESTFRYRCIRAKKGHEQDAATAAAQCESPQVDLQPRSPLDSPYQSTGSSTNVLYGSPPDDSMDEVRFSVELTRLEGLNGTYSLDIRRLKGNLRSYSFIYNTIRERAELNRQ